MKKEHFLLLVIIIIIFSALFLRLDKFIKNFRQPDKQASILMENEREIINNDSLKEEDIIKENSDILPTNSEELDANGCRYLSGEFWCLSKERCLNLDIEKCPRYGLEKNVLKSAREVILYRPGSEEIATSPLVIEGEARGNWFFEATLPIKLLTEEGELITAYYGTALGDWMTEDFVPFKAEIEFSTNVKKGYLVIEKDNPSGLQEYDASYIFTVNFQ